MNNSLAEVHFLKTHPVYEHWYPVFAVIIGTGLHCEVTIDGYTDFIFINRFGQAQHQATLNKQSEELSVIAMMSSFYTVMNLMCYFLILAATRLDIHLQQECVKLE